jgi:hypothetical protein
MYRLPRPSATPSSGQQPRIQERDLREPRPWRRCRSSSGTEEAGSGSRTCVCGLVSRRPNVGLSPRAAAKSLRRRRGRRLTARLWACSCRVVSCSFDVQLDSSNARCDHHRLVRPRDPQSVDHRVARVAHRSSTSAPRSTPGAGAADGHGLAHAGWWSLGLRHAGPGRWSSSYRCV